MSEKKAPIRKVIDKNITLHSIRQGYGVFNVDFNGLAKDSTDLFLKLFKEELELINKDCMKDGHLKPEYIEYKVRCLKERLGG